MKVRSKFEKIVIERLRKSKVDFKYEAIKIRYKPPTKVYTPDIILANGIIVELKGYFRATDRSMHKLIKEQHPELDIRFVFMNANNKIHKSSDTTYGDWCERHGFKYADKEIPKAWLK